MYLIKYIFNVNIRIYHVIILHDLHVTLERSIISAAVTAGHVLALNTLQRCSLIQIMLHMQWPGDIHTIKYNNIRKSHIPPAHSSLSDNGKPWFQQMSSDQ